MFCKACEFSERMKSRSPESNILEEQKEEKKTGPEWMGETKVQRRGSKKQTKLKTET
jgi:hypothetical protein